MQPANFYKKLGSQAVQCQLCHHFCLIKNNEVGICRVRKNQTGQLFSLVYGYPAAINLDPIEKKPLYHFQPASFSYSLGTYGCNFRCDNCQNWDISQNQKIEKLVNQLTFYSPETIVEQAKLNDCSSISYTYNEPTIFTEYALEIMKLARGQNLKNVWVSNGFMSKDCLTATAPLLDAINVDLKSMDQDFYQKNCGARLEPVLENLKAIKTAGIHLEITTLVIPTLTDELEMIKRIADFIVNELASDVPWHLSRFSAAISWKLKKLPDTPAENLFSFYEIGKAAGLKYIYLGNLPGQEKTDTYCPKCSQLAISRLGYEISRQDHHGRCANCDTSLDIIE